MVSLNAGPLYIALTQTASALPFLVFALPAGAIGDIVDPRRLILFTEVWMLCVALILTAATVGGFVIPVLLLVLTFALSMGDAFESPTWRAVLPEIVSKEDLGSAALNGIEFNFARAIGPALSVQQKMGGNGVNPYHGELQRIRCVAHRHEVPHWGNNLLRPSALLVGRDNQDSLTLQSNINLRSNLRDSAYTLRAYRGWEGRLDAVHATDVQEVRWIDRRRFHRDENILLAESRFGDRVEFNHI